VDDVGHHFRDLERREVAARRQAADREPRVGGSVGLLGRQDAGVLRLGVGVERGTWLPAVGERLEGPSLTANESHALRIADGEIFPLDLPPGDNGIVVLGAAQ
jgi:hypothetical protein